MKLLSALDVAENLLWLTKVARQKFAFRSSLISNRPSSVGYSLTFIGALLRGYQGATPPPHGLKIMNLLGRNEIFSSLLCRQNTSQLCALCSQHQ